MAHQSEGTFRLSIRARAVTRLCDLPLADAHHPEVHLFILPFGRTIADAGGAWIAALRRFAEGMNEDSIVAILTSAQDAAETYPPLADVLQLQLWTAVKLAEPVARGAHQLPEHHAALLILSRYRSPLRHVKTRIAYTYCPCCDKTTKDYGGKKHTYHEYGTLMSDVWRDITYQPGRQPREIIARLADLFALPPCRTLTAIDLGSVRALRPHRRGSVACRAIASQRAGVLPSQLINGDCLAELRKLPANSVDFCFADPPYNIAKRYDSWDDAIDTRDYLAWCDAWIDELARVLRPGRTCAILNIPPLAIRHFQRMKERLTFQSWIAWEGLSLPVRMIMPAHYAIVCFSKGESRALPGLVRQEQSELEAAALASLREGYCLRPACVAARRLAGQVDREPITDLWWDIHRLKHNSRRVDHPCQVPPALMRRLIALHTSAGEVVLDPFNGAGSTTLCAEALDRRYIGIELSTKYHELARSRHRMLRDGHDPFRKSTNIPVSKNSYVQRTGGMRYEVPKKTLQLELKRIAQRLGHLPTRDELGRLGRYPIRYYDEYFVSWAQACAAARTTGMSERRQSR